MGRRRPLLGLAAVSVALSCATSDDDEDGADRFLGLLLVDEEDDEEAAVASPARNTATS